MIHDSSHKGLMTLTLDDNTVLELQPLVMIEIGGREYISLTEPNEESEDVYFYEFVENEKGINLLDIEDKDILEAVLDEFGKWFDERLQLEEGE